MVFVGAVIMPHGALPFDGDPHSESKACRERHQKLSPDLQGKFSRLYEGMCRTGEELAKMEPDLIVMHTEHAICPTSAVGVYVNCVAAGSAEWNDCWQEFKVELKLNPPKADALLKHFQDDGVNCQGIMCFTDTVAPLKWGEVVPAWFILKAMKKDVKFLIISPSHEPRPVSSVTEDRLKVGRSLAGFVDKLPERVAIVISADLSHAYETDCKDALYLPATGWNFTPDDVVATAMERAILGWVKALPDKGSVDGKTELAPSENPWQHELALPWLQKATEYQIKGYSCGLIGFMLLHAFLAVQNKKNVNFSTIVKACEAPTYYGLMAAVFSIVQ